MQLLICEHFLTKLNNIDLQMKRDIGQHWYPITISCVIGSSLLKVDHWLSGTLDTKSDCKRLRPFKHLIRQPENKTKDKKTKNINRPDFHQRRIWGQETQKENNKKTIWHK